MPFNEFHFLEWLKKKTYINTGRSFEFYKAVRNL